MALLGMTVFLPTRRPESYVARWTDPDTGKRKQRRLGTRIKRDAYTAAAELAAKALGRVSIDRWTWGAFCERYERLHMRGTSPKNQEAWATTKRHLVAYGAPAYLDSVSSMWVAEWQAWLASDSGPGLATNSVALYSRYLRAALRWAQKKDLIIRAPHVDARVEEVPRSRAVTPAQFPQLLAAIAEVRTQDADRWNRFLRALSRCNLRINELRRLSWDQEAPIALDTSGPHPLIRFAPRSTKSRKRRIQVVLPAFWRICLETPVDERTGYVFRLPNGRGGQISEKRVVRIISDIGRQAGLVTDPATGKHATSHDIGRRAFVPQIDGILTQAEAHKAMGHGSWQTTTDYYDTRDALDVAAKLWEADDAGAASEADPKKHTPSGAPGGAGPDSPRTTKRPSSSAAEGESQ